MSDSKHQPLLDDSGGRDAPQKDDDSTPKAPINKAVLGCLYAALTIQWMLMSMTSAFFPDSIVGAPISNTWQGIIFAAFPFGSMVTAPFIEVIMSRLHKKTTLIVGLLSMIVFLLMFGAVPFVIPAPAQAPVFTVVGFLYGCGSTLAELGSYAMVAQIGSEHGNVGLLVSVSEVVIGIGVMLGPPVGGGLYALGNSLGLSDNLGFLFPFLCAVIFPVMDLVAVSIVLKSDPWSDTDSDDDEDTPVAENTTSRKCDFRRVIIAVGLVFSAVTYGALRPTLEIRLAYLGIPFDQLSSTSGLYFLLAGGVYMLGALPLGTFLDKGCCTRKRTQFAALLDVTAMYDGEAEDEVIVTYEKRCCWASPPNSALAPLLMIGIGAILNVVSVVFLAPLRLGDVIDLEVLDSIPFVAVGLFFSGLSCCFMVVPAMPALLVGIDTNDEGGQAWVTGMFGTFFALGTTAGPLIADLLMDMQVSLFCRATDWPIISNTTTQAVALVSTTLSPVSNSTDPYNKQHCFDGTFTVLGFVGVLYSVVFWIFLCDYSRVQRKNNEVRMGE